MKCLGEKVLDSGELTFLVVKIITFWLFWAKALTVTICYEFASAVNV